MNNTQKGMYIVLEGPAGVGKSTQIQLLASALQAAGLPVRMFREPDSQSHVTARALRNILVHDSQYPLNTRAEVLLYNAARALSLEVIIKARNKGVVCLVDRNYLTTLANQYYGRGNVPDYDTINDIIHFAVGDFEPDLTIVYDVPTDILIQRLSDRSTGKRLDTFDHGFLERVRAGYLLEAKQRNLPVVFATGEPKAVFQETWKLVLDAMKQPRRTLGETAAPPVAPPVESAAHVVPAVTPPNAPLLEKTARLTSITDVGRAYLDQVATDSTGPVYAFTGALDQVTVAAAMARLSRRGDDMRITLLDEFAGKAGQDAGLIHRVVTAYGDDSVQQLVGLHVVVENASNLLTKQIEWGRLAAYLEQSTRYIYYDQKDTNGRYKYYRPKTLSKNQLKRYHNTMDALFDNYSSVVRRLTEHLQHSDKTPKEERDGAWRAAIRAQACDAARSMLPVATMSTVGIFASGQALESMIMRLLAEDSKEAQECGQAILQQARKIAPAFLERADKPERGGATIAYRASTRKNVRTLAEQLLPQTQSGHFDAVTLTDYYPRNELDLLPHMLYEHSCLSEKELAAHVADLSYKDKIDILNAYIGERLNRRHRPGRALERAVYSWDIVCDYGIFRDLQRHRIVNDLSWQALTPRYGYEIPALIEQAGVAETFLDSFDRSLELHSYLQSAGKEVEAQYATLLGHKMRWKVTMNAREAFHFIELRTSPQGHPGYRKLVKQMYDRLAEAHPILSEAMIFVNRDEDPALTRLAAERYTQHKLQQLEPKEK